MAVHVCVGGCFITRWANHRSIHNVSRASVCLQQHGRAVSTAVNQFTADIRHGAVLLKAQCHCLQNRNGAQYSIIHGTAAIADRAVSREETRNGCATKVVSDTDLHILLLCV